MRSVRHVTFPLAAAAAAALVAAAPAVADPSPGATARASGGDVVTPVYPSIVRVRIARTERALERATKRYDNGTPAQAAQTMKVVRRQVAAAWRGAKYVVRTTPPPVPPEDREGAARGKGASAHRHARISDDPPTGPVYATPPETAFAVLTLQHDVSSTVVQLIDGAHGTGLDALAKTLNLVNDRRDAALDYILSVAPPTPPVEDRAGRAHTSQDDAAPTFDTVMPNLAPQLDDELQAIEGTKSDATDLTAGGRRLLTAADTQVGATKAFVTAHWPLVPAED